MARTKHASRMKRATNGIKTQPISAYRNRVLVRRQQPTRRAARSNAPAAVIELSSDDDDDEYHPPEVVPHPTRPIWYGDDLMITAEGKKDSLQLSDVLPLLHSSVGVRYEKRKELSTAATTANRIKEFHGHEYIPLGYMQSVLINLCKEQCRVSGKTMINVTENYAPDDSKHAQLGRVGYLFPKPIVEAVRAKAGQRVAQLERIIHIDHNGNPLHSSVEPKTSIEIRRNIKDIFPLIPESELAMVAERAWDKSRVGQARELSLALRIQMAVSAHIRHVHTNYDEILTAMNIEQPETRGENRMWIRDKLEPEIVERMKKYRGEDAEQLAAAWREVVVVNDESDGEGKKGNDAPQGLMPGMVLYSAEGDQFTVGPEDMALPSVEPGLRQIENAPAVETSLPIRPFAPARLEAQEGLLYPHPTHHSVPGLDLHRTQGGRIAKIRTPQLVR